MLSKTSRYGVRSVLYLALHTELDFLIGVKELAFNIKVSEPMLSKILQSLTKKKLIESKKGRNGGFFMTLDQKANKLMHVIRELEQSDRLINDCMLGQKDCRNCDKCPYFGMVASIRSELHSIYGNDTIEETARKLETTLTTDKEETFFTT
ncbi:MAG: Rrf2 family iron-sulfur cluster assembly transcriptional regulator [Saprospiraceae bacterium]|jgi:Rrf2 family iron-sulfur cluster assembly transcriptional regulator|tara:strand:- start:1449 stop:1901 length:453 start_codon:yes stop_codon:yes gene_type:complete